MKLKLVSEAEKELLWNINQKYLYEMTNYYSNEMDEKGNYNYGYFNAYFTESERKAYFILNDETLVGFALLNPYSYIGHSPDNVLAEFTVFPACRRKHYARKAAEMIFERNPGKWEIKYNEKNEAAKALRETVTAKFAPTKHHINYEETVLEFANV